jgi:hypothetical protein
VRDGLKKAKRTSLLIGIDVQWNEFALKNPEYQNIRVSVNGPGKFSLTKLDIFESSEWLSGVIERDA